MPRKGISLVELLVSMALVIFVMALISEAFVVGLESVRLLKAQGDMQSNLRTADGTIRDDLRDDHFIGYGPRLSDQFLHEDKVSDWGYFRIMQGNMTTVEGQADSIASYRSEDHSMAFTRYDTKNNRWTEVCYFLRPNGVSTEGNIPLYALMRRENVISNGIIPASDITTPHTRFGMIPFRAGDSDAKDVVLGKAGVKMLKGAGKSPTMPCNKDEFNKYTGAVDTNTAIDPRLPTTVNTVTSVGNDLILTDVVSFEIQIVGTSVTTTNAGGQLVRAETTQLGNLSTFTNNNPMFTGADADHPRVFDTWFDRNTKLNPTQTSLFSTSPNYLNVPMKVRVTGIQITIRVWDERTKQTRQITIVQDM